MATPVEIATTAAGAFVAAMGTDVWAVVRERCAAFFRRHASSEEQGVLAVRIDGFERDLAAVPASDREGTAAVYTRSLARDLQLLTERSTQAAAELGDLVAELAAVTGGARGTTTVSSRLRIDHNKVKRDLNFGGHTNTVGGQS